MKPIYDTATMNKILIVDDEMDICFFLSHNFGKRNIQTNFVHTLADAEIIIREEKPSILLLDNYLPDGFGVNFIEKAKSIHPGLMIVMITAHDSTQDRSKAYDNGADYFLSKPFTITEVNNIIEKLLSSGNN